MGVVVAVGNLLSGGDAEVGLAGWTVKKALALGWPGLSEAMWATALFIKVGR